jgi:ribosomal protein S18 acetylase RimI-like enzyme
MDIIKATGSNLADIRSFVLSYRDEGLFVAGNLELWGLDGIFESYMIKNGNYLLGCIFVFNKAHVSFLIDNPKRPGADIMMLINDFLNSLPNYQDLLVTNLHGKYLRYILPAHNLVDVEFAKLDNLVRIDLSYQINRVYVIKPLSRDELYSYYVAKSKVVEFGEYPDINRMMRIFEQEKKLYNTIVCKIGNEVVGGVTVDGLSEVTGVIISVFVIPAHRQRGIATALMKEVIKRYKTAKRVLYIFYHSNVLDSGKLYRKLGFVPYEKGYIFYNKK